jgi:hypothetical protein
VRLREDRGRRAGCRDDDVAGAEDGVELVPRRGARAPDRLGRLCGMRHRAAHDRHLVDALRLHVQGGQLAHLAGADDDDVASFQVAENLSREGDGRVAHRHGARAEAGFRAHALADREARVKQPVQHRADRLRLGRRGVRLLDLSEDLRLADDERVEPAGHAEQVPRGVEIDELMHVRRDFGCRHPVEVADEPRHVVTRPLRVFADGVDLRAVARRDDHRFARRSALGERDEGLAHAAHVEVDALAQFDRSGPMADSDEDQLHQKLWLWVKK